MLQQQFVVLRVDAMVEERFWIGNSHQQFRVMLCNIGGINRSNIFEASRLSSACSNKRW
jgi:hypothetical protein